MSPSVGWLRARIEKQAPRGFSEERQALYGDLANFGPETETYLLASVWWIQQVHRGRQGVRDARDWYAGRVGALRRQLEKIERDDLVAGGLDAASVVFYPLHHVDCRHGRRTKRCLVLREKVETLHGLKRVLASLALNSGNPLRRGMEKRLRALPDEIRALDRLVIPSTAKPEDFCTPGAAGNGPPVTTPAQRGGRPRDDLQNRLLEVIGEHLCELGHSRQKAAEMVARLLVSVFGRKATSVEDLAEGVLRHWRTLRAPQDRTRCR